MRPNLNKLPLWGVMVGLALMMIAAYIAIFHASKEIQIKEVPLAKNPHARP